MRRPTAKTGKINVIDYNRNQDGAELANRQQLGTAPLSIPVPRSTDMIKCRNSSGVDLVAGNVLEIDDHEPTEDLTRRSMSFIGITPTGPSVPFGILLRAMPDDEIGDLQCSGVCVALVNVTDEDHRFGQTNASAVLQSAESGPCEILWKPTGTGESACLVRFGGEGGGESGRKFIDFELDEELTTSMASADATIVTEYGPGSEASSEAVTVLNPMGQAFFGEAGARGLALWDHDQAYVIIQLAQECLPEAPAQYTLSIEDIEFDDCTSSSEANNYGEPMTLERVGPYTWRHEYTLDTHVGGDSLNRVAFVAEEGAGSPFCEVVTEAYWEMRMAPNGTITVEYYKFGEDTWYSQWERYTWVLAGSGSRVFDQSNTSIPPTTRVSGQEGAGFEGATFYSLNHENSTLLLTAVP